MIFSAPSWLHLGWLVAVLLIVRWLVLGRRTERTSTMLIWRRLLDDSPAVARRRSLRPELESSVEALLGIVLVVLVAGPSMLRADERATRWIVDAGAAMSAPGRAAVVADALGRAGAEDTVVRTTDLPRALAEARVSGDRVRLVADVVPQPLPRDVELLAAGAPIENVGITVVEARPVGEVVEVFVVVESSGPAGTVGVRPSRGAAVDVAVAPDAPAEVTLRVPDVASPFRIELIVAGGVRNDVAADDAVSCIPRPSARVVVADGHDVFVDALSALGLDVVEGTPDLAGEGDLLVTAAATSRGGPTLRIVAPESSANPRGALVPVSPAFDDVPFAGLRTSAAAGLSGRPVLMVRDVAAATVSARTLSLGLDLDDLAERPVFPLLVRACLREVGFEGGSGDGGHLAEGVLDRRETLGDADEETARAATSNDVSTPSSVIREAEEAERVRSLRRPFALLALGLLAALVRLRTARPARGNASSP